MKLFFKAKDGGPDSKVTGYWLVESKRFFSIALVKFAPGSRDAYHTHAFNAVSFLFSSILNETFKDKSRMCDKYYLPSIYPIVTKRNNFHKVTNITSKNAWVLTFRGPWDSTWKEYLPKEDRELILTHGRVEIPT